MKRTGMRTCPRCGRQTLPRFSGGSAVACQNEQCRAVVDKRKRVAGRFDKQYEKIEWFVNSDAGEETA